MQNIHSRTVILPSPLRLTHPTGINKNQIDNDNTIFVWWLFDVGHLHSFVCVMDSNWKMRNANVLIMIHWMCCSKHWNDTKLIKWHYFVFFACPRVLSNHVTIWFDVQLYRPVMGNCVCYFYKYSGISNGRNAIQNSTSINVSLSLSSDSSNLMH